MTQRLIFDLAKKSEQEMAEILDHEPMSRREFIAKWGFSDDKELNKQILSDLENVINTEINNDDGTKRITGTHC